MGSRFQKPNPHFGLNLEESLIFSFLFACLFKGIMVEFLVKYICVILKRISQIKIKIHPNCSYSIFQLDKLPI